jgi:hypothetical protein
VNRVVAQAVVEASRRTAAAEPNDPPSELSPRNHGQSTGVLSGKLPCQPPPNRTIRRASCHRGTTGNRQACCPASCRVSRRRTERSVERAVAAEPQPIVKRAVRQDAGHAAEPNRRSCQAGCRARCRTEPPRKLSRKLPCQPLPNRTELPSELSGKKPSTPPSRTVERAVGQTAGRAAEPNHRTIRRASHRASRRASRISNRTHKIISL